LAGLVAADLGDGEGVVDDPSDFEEAEGPEGGGEGGEDGAFDQLGFCVAPKYQICKSRYISLINFGGRRWRIC